MFVPLRPFVLSLIRNHFSYGRGLHEAASFYVTVNLGRDVFISKFVDKLRQFKMVIVSWYQDMESGARYGHVLIGAHNKQVLEKEVTEIKKLVSEIP